MYDRAMVDTIGLKSSTLELAKEARKAFSPSSILDATAPGSVGSCSSHNDDLQVQFRAAPLIPSSMHEPWKKGSLFRLLVCSCSAAVD